MTESSTRVFQWKGQEDIPDAGNRLLIIGCGPSGLAVARELGSHYRVVVVDPKDYYEYTPGILRGFFDPSHLDNLQVPLATVFQNFGDVTHIRGTVVDLLPDRAKVRPVNRSDGQDSQDLEIEFDYAVVATGSEYAGGGLWKVTGAPGEESWTSLKGRNAGLASTLESLKQLEVDGGTCIMVGAGLVGVELAAEAAYFRPKLKVVLADLASEVLPALPKAARSYAHRWLEEHNVQLRLGVSLPEGGEAAALGIDGPCLVLRCAGVKMRNDFMKSLNCLDDRGAIRVNRSMQVLGKTENNDSVGDSFRIFALGDCISIEGVEPPLPREIYPAEAAAEVVVDNLHHALKQPCLSTTKTLMRKLKVPLNAMTICSLGPKDAVFVMNGAVRLTGWAASVMKGQIESTKMGQYRSELWGSFVWSLIPHW